MEKKELIREELSKVSINKKIDYLAKYIKDQFMFATVEQIESVVSKVLDAAYEFDEITEREAVDFLVDKGFEVKEKEIEDNYPSYEDICEANR